MCCGSVLLRFIAAPETPGVCSQRVLTGNIPSAPSVDARLAALAARQHGVAGVRQLVALGLSRSAISKRVARGVLHRRYRGVYTVGRAALSREAEWLAAVVAVGGVALSHHSAAELHGLTRARAQAIDVIVPHHRRAGRNPRPSRSAAGCA